MKKFFRTTLFVCFFVSFVSLGFASGAFEEGDQGPDVAALQSQLGALGYNAGPADGSFGSLTASAVKAFQRDRGLEADGVVGYATYRALMGRDIPVSRDSSNVSAARRIMQTALGLRGVPYSFGGTTPDAFDCSGFTRYVFSAYGVYLPRAADEQFNVGRGVSYSRLQPGDLVFFSTYAEGASHVGIYLGGGQFVSATSSRGVAVDSLESSYWGPRYIGARRVL
ncbi:MAG: NlpC/P60 family protein [Sporomusaceae bacterium]|nr:NlpC/P60 family protein [Sporomusaceae bacterium]